MEYLVFALILLSGCGLTTRSASLPDNKNTKAVVGELSGHFTAIDGSDVQLPANGINGTAAQVVMFVSETCSVCRKESKALVQDRKIRGVPKNVMFYSIVLGSVLQDAIDWQKSLAVDWQTGIEPGDDLFHTRCPEGQTPCVFVTNPSGTTVKLIGEHSIEEWEQVTGQWIF